MSRSEHTVRFGDSILGVVQAERGTSTLLAAKNDVVGDQQNDIIEQSAGDPIPSHRDVRTKRIAPTIRQVSTASTDADRKVLRKSARMRMLRKIFSVDTAVTVSAVMDFALNAVYIVGLVVVGSYAIYYISQGNVLMTLSCAVVIWIMTGISDRIGGSE